MASPLIELDQLCFGYDRQPVLKALDWQWCVDERWAVLGGNASGKSTLANLLCGELRAQEGDMRLNLPVAPGGIQVVSFQRQRKLIEHDIRFDDSETREDAFDMGTTVRRIILQGGEADSTFEQLVETVGIAHILDRGIRYISTGEARKALLAQALYSQPSLLILDNPLEGLDKDSQHEVRALIEQLMQAELPVLPLVNRLEDLPDSADHILLLEEGQGKTLDRGELKGYWDNEQQSVAEIPPPLARDFEVQPHLPLFELHRVKASYGDTPVLSDINWTMDWGQHCCIIGPNGSGKSTLLSLIDGDNHKAYGQEISLFGRRRGSGETVWDIKRRFGIVSTQLQLKHIPRMRVAEVVASGLFDTVGLYNDCGAGERQLVLDWLAAVELLDHAKSRFSDLSFGEQRLALLARAMVKAPLILVLDEPCLGLDDQHRNRVLAIVERIAASGHTHLLYVSHRADEIPGCITQQLQLVPVESGGYTAVVTLL